MQPLLSKIYTTDYIVRIFFDQYIVRTTDPRILYRSLDGLPSLLANAELSSDLVQAVEIVAWASLGNRFSWPDLVNTYYACKLDTIVFIVEA